jgi:hypothetical protein
MTPQAAARLLLRTRQALLGATCLLCAFWAWRGSGVVRLFEDVQVRWTGAYDSVFAVLFSFLTMFVVCMAIGSVVTRLVKRRVPPEEWETVLRTTTSLWDNSWKRKNRS